MQNKTHEELIEIIEKQNRMIAELINENAEKENMINVLMTEFRDTSGLKYAVRSYFAVDY